MFTRWWLGWGLIIGPLMDLAASSGVAFIGLTHLSKDKEALGSRIVEKARVVAKMTQPDPEGQPNRRKLWVDKTAALDALPGTAPTGPATEAGRLAATGTDGPINPNPPLPVPYGGDGRGRIVSGSGRFDDVRTGGYESDSHAPEPDTLLVFDATGRVQAEPVGSGGGGIRTPGTLAGPTVFKTVPIGHSGTPPGRGGPAGVTGPPRSGLPRRRRSARPR